jgi:hypothetical protein
MRVYMHVLRLGRWLGYGRPLGVLTLDHQRVLPLARREDFRFLCCAVSLFRRGTSSFAHLPSLPPSRPLSPVKNHHSSIKIPCPYVLFIGPVGAYMSACLGGAIIALLS